MTGHITWHGHKSHDAWKDVEGSGRMMLQTQALRVGQVKEPCIGLIQENSIESSVNDCLPYISENNGLCLTTLTYPK